MEKSMIAVEKLFTELIQAQRPDTKPELIVTGVKEVIGLSASLLPTSMGVKLMGIALKNILHAMLQGMFTDPPHIGVEYAIRVDRDEVIRECELYIGDVKVASIYQIWSEYVKTSLSEIHVEWR